MDSARRAIKFVTRIFQRTRDRRREIALLDETTEFSQHSVDQNPVPESPELLLRHMERESKKNTH